MLPIELKNIILNYYYQLQHIDKFKKCLGEIKTIEKTIISNQHMYNTFFYLTSYDNLRCKTIQLQICPLCKNIKNVRVTIFYDKENYKDRYDEFIKYTCCKNRTNTGYQNNDNIIKPFSRNF